MRVVFLHGAGRAGADNWPSQVAEGEPDWLFLDRADGGDHAERDADRILTALRDAGGGHVVASSFGGNAAIIAAQRRPDLVRSLALFEPACFDLARGRPAVEEHIAAMDLVFAMADDPTVPAREFSRRFAEGIGTEPPDLPDDELEARVARLRAMRPPWRTGIDAAAGIPVPVLVVIGGWNPLYDQTAEELAALGAERAEIPGAGHRVHDVPQANALLRKFWERVDAPECQSHRSRDRAARKHG